MCRAFVAVDERVISSQTESHARGEVSKIWSRIAVKVCVLWAGERRIQQALVAHTAAATVVGELALVDGDGE